jgi:hypothetical protein
VEEDKEREKKERLGEMEKKRQRFYKKQKRLFSLGDSLFWLIC